MSSAERAGRPARLCCAPRAMHAMRATSAPTPTRGAARRGARGVRRCAAPRQPARQAPRAEGGRQHWDGVSTAGGASRAATEEYSSWHDIFREQVSGENPDPELQAILNGTESNAELEAKIKARFEASSEEHLRARTGKSAELDVKFLEPFDPFDLWIEFECVEPLNEEHKNCFDQMFKESLSSLAYDRDHAASSLDAHFHDLKDPQFDKHWGRCWFDIGTADQTCFDVLINSMRTVSREYVGIKRVFIGGNGKQHAKASTEDLIKAFAGEGNVEPLAKLFADAEEASGPARRDPNRDWPEFGPELPPDFDLKDAAGF